MVFPLFEGIESRFRETIGITARVWSCSTRTIMELINQETRGAEGFTREEEIWERCAQEAGLEGEAFEEARKKRQGRLQETITCPMNWRLEIVFEGLDSTWHILGKAGDIAPYSYAGEVEKFV